MENAINQTHGHPAVSDKYGFISTAEVIEALTAEGWEIASTQEVMSRGHHSGYQKHMIRFQHPDFANREIIPEAVFMNSHDRSCRARFLAGLHITVCANGLIMASETFESFVITHIGSVKDKVIHATNQIIENVPKIMNKVNDYKSISLTQEQRLSFAAQSFNMVYDSKFWNNYRWLESCDNLLKARRPSEKETNLWNTFNVVQEKLVNGGRDLLITRDGNLKERKATKNLDLIVNLNRDLWSLTDKSAQDLGQLALIN